MKQVAIVLQIPDGREEGFDRIVAQFTGLAMANGAASVQTEEWDEWFPHVITQKQGGCEAGH